MIPRPRNGRLRISLRPGVTMFELLACMVITSMLVMGLASALRVMTTSLESPTDNNLTFQDAGDALNRLNADLRLAMQFTERTATAVTFTIPDQNDDSIPETVRYSWAGAGNPLTRTVNGLPSPAISLVDNVQSLNFSFLTRTAQPNVLSGGVQQLIANNSTSTTVNINATSWVGEYFLPTLPANTTSWNISRVRLYMKVGSIINLGNVQVSIANAGANQLPAGGALETYSLPLLNLSTTLSAIDIPFSSLTNLTPGQALFLQVSAPTNPLVPVSVAMKANINPAPTNMSYFTSSTQGAAWTPPGTPASLQYQVYGTITMQGP